MADLMDEVYGDLGLDHHGKDTVAAFDEDSVDIYSGLESPNPRSTERNGTLLSPQNLNSMDLYEEIITQEQQERESSYNELRTRYKAAEVQVEELLNRLQQIETKNTLLNTENSRLKKNICALIKTAKMEVVRKDEEINRLNRSFRPGRFPASHHQSLMDCRKNQVPTRLNTSGPSPSSLTQVPTGPNTSGSSPSSLTQVPTRPNTSGPSPSSLPPEPRQDCIVTDLCQHLNKGRNVDKPCLPPTDATLFRPPHPHATDFRPPLPVTSRTSVGDSNRDVVQPPLPPSDATFYRPPLPDELGFRPPVPDETVYRPPLPDELGFRPSVPDETGFRPPVAVTSERCLRDSEAPVQDADSSVSFNKVSLNRNLCELRLSDEPKQTKSSEVRRQNTRLSDRRHKNSPVVNKDSHSNEKLQSHAAQTHSGKHDSKSSKSRYCSSDVEVDRRSERAKSPASDILHCTMSSERTSKGLSKDSPDIQSVGYGRHGKERQREKDNIRGSRSTKDMYFRNSRHAYSNQAGVTEQSSKSLNCPTKDRQRREERRKEVEIGKEKHRSGERSSKRKSTSERGKELEPFRTKEGKPSSMNVSKTKEMDSCVRVRQTRAESAVLLARETRPEKSSVEENSPNRKLSFMETLNLTLSPVKKPSKRGKDVEPVEDKPPVEDQSGNLPGDRGPPGLEDLLVLDEVNSSIDEFEEGVVEPVVQSSLEIPSEPEHFGSRQTDKESCRNSDKESCRNSDKESCRNSDKESCRNSDKESCRNSDKESCRNLDVESCRNLDVESSRISDKAMDETIVPTEQLKCHVEVVDSTVHDGCEGRPALLEASVDHGTETTNQQTLVQDSASSPDGGSFLRTPTISRLENFNSESSSMPDDLADAAVASTELIKNFVNNSNMDLSTNGLIPEQATSDLLVVTNSCVYKSNHESPSLVCESQGFETVTQDPSAAVCVESFAISNCPGEDTSEPLQLAPVIQHHGLKQLPASVMSNLSLENSPTEEVQDVSMDAVSSTRCVESIPKICIASDVMANVTEITKVCEEERTSPLSVIGVSKVSSTTGEVVPCERQTPKKSFHTKPSYGVNEEENVEPSSSLPMTHDEDSMMLTLSSLKVIPNPISPLTSPVRLTRKSLQACRSQPAYAKSLSKEFSCAAEDPGLNKVEVTNDKENPGCTTNHAAQPDEDGTSDHPSSAGEELEEGEILSESDGDDKMVTRSSLAKTLRPISSVQNQSPKSCSSLSDKAMTKNVTSPFNSPTSNKTRYKIIQPTLPEAPLSTVEEVMEIFAKIRFECRKKYFKFHSVFSKKSFSSLMGMSLDSFTEFVDSMRFTKLCSQEDVLKENLKKILIYVLTKLADNGIVNRLFDQQPQNMKAKLWEFVDVQLDFLFLEIQTALRSVCKPSKTNQSTGAETKGKPSLSGNMSLKQLPKSSKLQTRSPKNPAMSPKNPARSPKNPARSPKNPAMSPRNPARSPRNPARSPRYPARSPRNSARSPRNSARSPRNSAISPRNSARSLKPAKTVNSSASTASGCKRQQDAVECLTRSFGHKRPQEEFTECVEPNIKRSRFHTAPSCKTGLGRGKNIRMSSEEEDKDLEPQTSDQPHIQSHIQSHTQSHIQSSLQRSVEIVPSNTTSSEMTAAYVRRLSQNGAFHDKSDFEILTEQQASSLTFNLVTDSQMGEIFKCLLQGSDLLETNVAAAENQGWPLGTPRKEGELFPGITTPSKLVTPSKLIATWSAISPQKFSFPNSKIQVPVNPELLDESCMLEVPSALLESRMAPQSSVFSQRSYSILAEDLAVSLTIPSPLKSESHLSFLHPAIGEKTSAPDSVISAHFSEDALLEGEDATEQDIHLALDTDNSSSASSGASKTREPPVNPLFHFKPHLPMQAVVTEKSNDHFIVRIRHADMNSSRSSVNFCNLGNNSNGSGENLTNPAINSTGTEIISPSQAGVVPRTNCTWVGNSMSQAVNCIGQSVDPTSEVINYRAAKSPQTAPGEQHHGTPPEKHCYEATISTTTLPIHHSCPSTSTETASELSEPCLSIVEDPRSGKPGKKQTKHHVETKAKRYNKDAVPEKSKHKKKSSKSPKGKDRRSSKRERNKVSSPLRSTPSPSSLSAKNIIKKRGEVVVSWTRDEDRDILLALKTKGASRDTFSALSDKMKKTPAQISERFSQLMKLFKKKGKMAS